MLTIKNLENAAVTPARREARRKFLYYFPKGFRDPKYNSWERDYKWQAHLSWEEELNRHSLEDMLQKKKYQEVCMKAIRIESRTNLLFSFEKMALRDAVKSPSAAKAFATGLHLYLYAEKSLHDRFEIFRDVLAALPVVQTKVLSWPILTVFGFIARPDEFIFLKPKVTKTAAAKYAFDFKYHSRPSWPTYESMLSFAEQVGIDLTQMKPADMIDIQSFIWVLGSDEYPD